MKPEDEIQRFNRLQVVIGGETKVNNEVVKETDIRKYAKHLLREGGAIEKRGFLGYLKSRLVLKDKAVAVEKVRQ